jgi:hypothetical protein
METFGKWTLEYIALASVAAPVLYCAVIVLIELKDYMFDKFTK